MSLESSLNAVTTLTAYQHLLQLYQCNNPALDDLAGVGSALHETLTALPESFRKKIFEHIANQAEKPVESKYGEVHVFQPLTKLQEAIKKVAAHVLDSFKSVETIEIVRRICEHTERPFSEGSSWEENNVTHDMPLLLKTMHDVLGDLTPELQEILDGWAKQAKDKEKRVEAKSIITSFFKDRKKDSLGLSGLNLKSFPSGLNKLLSRIRMLSLNDNCLTELPKEITQLHNLVLLGLSNNCLTELPQGIAELRNLSWLFLTNNQLTSLSKEIGSLQALTTLNLYGNRLTSLPEEIGLLQNLKELELQANFELEELPDGLGKLPQTCKISVHRTECLKAVCNNLEQAQKAPGYQGPRFSFFEPPMDQHNTELKSLESSVEELSSRLKETPKPLPALYQLGLLQRNTIRDWINRELSVANYEGRGEYRDFWIRNLLTCLEHAENNSVFREDFLKSISLI